MSHSDNKYASSAESLDEAAHGAIADYNKLKTDDKLAFLYYVYKKMGSSVTPAAPGATEPELAPALVGDFMNLSHENQLQIMRDVVNRADTEYSRDYGALKENNQLMVWYVWAEAMGENVIDMPSDYKASDTINNLVSQIEKFDFGQQISILREIVGDMGYSEVKPIPTQSETGKTTSL